jgi:hypothetical protein
LNLVQFLGKTSPVLITLVVDAIEWNRWIKVCWNHALEAIIKMLLL